MKVHIRTMELGWGMIGPVSSKIRVLANMAGVKLEPWPFARIHELVVFREVNVTKATKKQLAKFRELMDRYYPAKCRCDQ